MMLSQILEDVKDKVAFKIDNSIDSERIEITGITDFTGDVSDGYIFVCVKGGSFDGHSVAKDMIEKGASIIVCDHDLGLANQIVTADTRKFYGELVASWFHHPERKMTLIGVTGTNGKTTMTTLIRDVLKADGRKVGLIGTTGIFSDETPLDRDDSTPTTPKVFELYSIFDRMCKDGCDSVVMEVTSFALEQNRIGPAHYDYGVFTNLTQDHLDYHKTMENYYLAKKKLFDCCECAIVNTDDEYGQRLFSEINCEKYSYGLKDGVDVLAHNIKAVNDRIEFTVTDKGVDYPLSINLLGRFNGANVAAATKVSMEIGVSFDNIQRTFLENQGVRGRCEIIPTGRDFMVICDYAHTPDALENVLPSIKEQTAGRLICLFGCGGDRDNTKRPKMGAAAEKYADYLIVTSDNPRNENPDSIIDEIFGGIKGDKPWDRITSRKDAIFHAVKIAKTGDIVILAGKGHEDYQILAGNKHIHFDEREIVAEALEQLN